MAARRITRLLDNQSLGPGRWARHFTKNLDGEDIEVFMGRDKNKQQIREEVYLKKAKKVLEPKLDKGVSLFVVKHKRLISADWKDLVQISAPSEEGRPIIRWKLSVLEQFSLDRVALDEEIQSVCAPRQKQEPWDG